MGTDGTLDMGTGGSLAVRISLWLWGQVPDQGDRSLAMEIRLLSGCGDKFPAMEMCPQP